MKNIAHLHVLILLNLIIYYFLWVYCSSYFAQIIFRAPLDAHLAHELPVLENELKGLILH